MTDPLGSLEALTDESGTLLARASFAAFGARRGSDWQGPPDAGELSAITETTRRGFTGHSMLDAVALIHMNGRVYDPVVGRFLSADPLIQSPTETQAWNRYSYVLNNPLSYTDPSGYLSWRQDFRGFMRFVGASLLASIPYVGPFLAEAYKFYAAGETIRDIKEARAEPLAVGLQLNGVRNVVPNVNSASWAGGVISGGTRQRPFPGPTSCFSSSCDAAAAAEAVDELQASGAILSFDVEVCLQSEDECRATAYRNGQIAGTVVLTGASFFGIGEIAFAASAARGFSLLRALSGVPAATGAARGAPQILRDVVLQGGRSGRNVKNLVGPPNSVVRGDGERAFVTNDRGQVVLDITRYRVKPVIPGQGFGSKRPPTSDELSMLNRVLGAGS